MNYIPQSLAQKQLLLGYKLKAVPILQDAIREVESATLPRWKLEKEKRRLREKLASFKQVIAELKGEIAAMQNGG